MSAERAEQLDALRTRIKELERRVRVLRTSRRVLMTLVSRLEHERRAEADRFERERALLRRRNVRYARKLLERHHQIFQLERLLTNDEIASAGRDDPADRRSDTRHDGER